MVKERHRRSWCWLFGFDRAARVWFVAWVSAGSQTGASGFPQEARLENRTGFLLQPHSFPKTPRGPTETANKKGVFVIRADGSVIGGPGGLFSGGVKGTAMQPGDMVVVPEKVITVSRGWQNTVQTAQILSAVALAVTAARTF